MNPSDSIFEFRSIGQIHTCFKEKFGIPRQAGLAKHALGFIKLHNGLYFSQCLQKLETFTHIWVIFVFHQQNRNDYPISKIRPPRLGGVDKVGVFASRSPHRYNPIGISVLKLDRIEINAKEGAELHVSGVDILDKTPILDIKPYLPYCDHIPVAKSGWIEAAFSKMPVEFEQSAESCIQRNFDRHPHLKSLIQEILSLDPRPASQKSKTKPYYGTLLIDYNIIWNVKNGKIWVTQIQELSNHETKQL